MLIMVAEHLHWTKILCSCFRFIWLWLLVVILKSLAERCALLLYCTSLNRFLEIFNLFYFSHQNTGYNKSNILLTVKCHFIKHLLNEWIKVIRLLQNAAWICNMIQIHVFKNIEWVYLRKTNKVFSWFSVEVFQFWKGWRVETYENNFMEVLCVLSKKWFKQNNGQ